MYNNQVDPDSVYHRMCLALSYKIDQRCADLTVLFDCASKKELAKFFPILLDNVFGPQGSTCWSLRRVLSDPCSNEFNVLLNFFKPHGPVFKLIYNLLQEPTLKYDFNLAYLPRKVREMLDSPNMTEAFYQEVLQINSQSKQATSLLLNPFDYYIFHFAYHLVDPYQQKMSSEDHWNTVYYNLCAEYLMHFFPVSLDEPIRPSVSFYSGKNPMHIPLTFQRATNRPMHLLKNNLFGASQSSDIQVKHIDRHPRNEIWRSETILMAIKDFWLSNDRVCMQYNNLNMSLSMQHMELPSEDYIRIIRTVVKHLHAFASTSSLDKTALGELKKMTLPMIQSKMYVFLRNLLYRWPLDESFRLVLELWLSFIQPWRYSHNSYLKRGGILKSTLAATGFNGTNENKYAGEENLQFIAENLLVYVVIFQQLLPRFTRVDLASPKNAQMLFRLTKVFSQKELVPLIKRIEALVDNKNYSPSHTFNPTQQVSMPPLSPTTRWSTNTTCQIYDSTHIEAPKEPCQFFPQVNVMDMKYINVVRQKINELEGPNFCYKPLFTPYIAPEVLELLQLTKIAEGKASAALIQSQTQDKKSTGFFSSFMQFLTIDKLSSGDREKTPLFLSNAADSLINIFEINEDSALQCTQRLNLDLTPETNHGTGMDFQILTPEKVRERQRKMKYDGDPELKPIQSNEIGFLVRLFYRASLFINEHKRDAIQDLYERMDFTGRFAKSYIEAPTSAYKYEKRDGRSLRLKYVIPARISLRRFADKKFLLFMFLGMMLFRFFGFGLVYFVIVYILFSVACAVEKAIFSKNFGRDHVDLNDTME